MVFRISRKSNYLPFAIYYTPILVYCQVIFNANLLWYVFQFYFSIVKNGGKMKDNDFLKNIGKRIRSLRKTHRLSQETLAELSDLHPTYIGKIERATINASIISFQKIAKAFNMALSELLNIPSAKNEQKDLSLEKIYAVLKTQKVDVLKHIEKIVNEFIDFSSSQNKK